jgi:hypothetical protein
MEEMKVMRDGVGQETHRCGVEIEDDIASTRTTITPPVELRTHLIPLGIYEG